MLLFQWQRKPIDNGAKDLQEFSNTIESFCFVDELEENIVDGPPDV